MKYFLNRSLLSLLFLASSVLINETPARAVSCTVSGTGASQTLAAPTDGNSCTFEFSTSNVVDLNGAVNITVTLTNGSGANNFTISLAATIVDPNGPNNNIALTGIVGFDNLAYNNAATALRANWDLGGSRCGGSSHDQLDGFGSFSHCYSSGSREIGPVFALSNDDPGNFTANDQGVLFAVHLALTPSTCSGFFANRSTPGTTTLGEGECGYTGSDPQSVPEPSTMMLLGAGLIGLSAWGRKHM
jgi:PEP-CTERM motif-containing protein